ncbi:anti-phage defense ZorAB system protein ZorA [Halomonas qaidamensis]|uniref:Anti-phage defense ZorAB system protein ZorA n=1 Tax=Halomonas qaidamensis TaxID=2866211 RepID=A0ABY6JPU8_9GAMM|nr:anti-phage ZorAB system protein ZorA [Halomonas qaidamensis]UYV19319.1 anti-phage defense ZorAB system protein ZorA [Halomonas qaidamensis]
MGINEQQLDISGLLPNFFSFPSFETASDLSAIFVVALITLFFIFLLIAVVHSWKANRRIKWLNNVLSQENEDTVFNSRSDLRNKALKRNGTEAHLWCEFDETLIEVKEGEQHKLFNVYDADYFFNAASLAPGITESRLIAAVPGFLTAIGVIGTFVGLQLGLSQLNIGNDVAVDEMKDGLAYVISGAKFAFMTSVWGVLLSVLFNFIEKCLENGVRKQIRELQVTIDKIFPRLTAEMQLKRIADDGGESREALQGLAEKIGDKMQESLLEATAGIQQGLEQSLQNVMGPAMDRLVNDASDGSQRAMEQLIETFMDKFGQQGAEQRNSMDQASKGVSDAVDSMNQALNGFISNLNQNQQAASEREQGLMRHIAEQIDSMADHNRYQQQEFLASTHAQVKAVRDVLNQHQTAAGQREQELVEHISSQVDKLVSHTQQQAENITRVTGDQLGNMSELFQKVQEKQSERERALGLQFESTIAEIKTTMQKQIEATQNLLSDSRQLQEDMANNSQSLQRLASSIHEGATELARSTTQLKEYGATLQQASTKLSTSIFSASESTEYLASENHKAAESVRMVRDQIQSAITAMERTVGNLDQMVQLADGSFKALEQHQNNYLAALKKNIGELAEQGTRLLSDYAEQANGQTRDHLKIWAQSANDYAAQMNNAANALSSVVDEIETKVGN